MKTIALITCLFLLSASTVIGQEQLPEDYKDFKILIERTGSGFKLTNMQGGAWIQLSFTMENNKPQAIDEYGMTRLDKVSPKKDSNLTDYLFTISKKKDAIILKGIEGTLWKELTFSLSKNQSQVINQYGMSD